MDGIVPGVTYGFIQIDLEGSTVAGIEIEKSTTALDVLFGAAVWFATTVTFGGDQDGNFSKSFFYPGVFAVDIRHLEQQIKSSVSLRVTSTERGQLLFLPVLRPSAAFQVRVLHLRFTRTQR